MSVLGYILLFTIFSSLASLCGGIFLLYKEEFALKISHFLTSFAAGALLGGAFFDLLPEAADEGGEGNIFPWILLGILLLFLIERFIRSFHHHQHKHLDSEKAKSVVPLVVLSDSVHNFVDGMVIAFTFLTSIPLGIVTSLVVISHEIPQEIGDFSILMNRGVGRVKNLLLNFLSAIMAVVGAVLAYLLGDFIESLLPVLLSLAAGFFIYIAASDLIPEIHNEDRMRVAFFETMLLVLGIGVIWFLTGILKA